MADRRGEAITRPASSAALVTLTTDFGTTDPYVAEMKGVLCTEGPPGLCIVDLSHALPRHDVRAAAHFLEAAVPRFPHGTVHVVVIDPGVGSDRNALIACAGGQVMVAPDNGVLTALLDSGASCFVIDTQQLDQRAISSTFHGRDLFAPIGARLAWGVPVDQLGTPLATPVRLEEPTVEQHNDQLTGTVIHVDHFGNLITNVKRAHLRALRSPLDRLRVAAGSFQGLIQSHYAQVAVGAPIALFDSQGRLELAVREGHAASQLGLQRGSHIVIKLPLATFAGHQ